MANDVFGKYLSEINKAYIRGDATEHTHRPALKSLIEALGKKVTATNEPKRRTDCGAPDILVSRTRRKLDQKIGYVECKDIGTNLKEAAKSEQIKKRYLPSLGHNFILTDYVEFRWYSDYELRVTAQFAREGKGGTFEGTEQGRQDVAELLGAFLEHEPEKIKIPKELATKMAHKAKLMRDIIKNTFERESDTGTLHGQFQAFKEVLLHDLTEEQFADMYAQTICYGLFSARCHIEDMTVFGKDKYAAFHGIDERAKELTREHAAYLLPKTNPFFRDIFGDIAGPKLDDRIVWLVDDLVELLKQADMGVILRDFARRKKRKDPVFHFYETFLAEYDPKMRKKRGEYYTPDEVVSYIVRSVDILLKEKFGLKRGLADESKIQGKDLHRLLILDPAVGTGTFLFEAIEQIYKRFSRQKGMWSGYVKEHLLPRIFGFEIMMAPYAVAHMKLGLQLAETGYDFASDERLGIYLTNTLEEAEETSRTLFAQYLSKEATAANKVKKELPIMVVLGNPPYSISSQNRSKWILNLLEDYKKGLHEKKLNIDDDFIKFIKFGQHRIEQTGCGILAFISNNTYIDGITHRRMRRSLMETFSEIYILDLHGSSKKREKCPDGSKDENVFDIQQGVSIGIFVKQTGKKGLAKVKYSELWGLRKNKYEQLSKLSVRNTDWNELKPSKDLFFFVPRDEVARDEYMQYWSLPKVFTVYGSGLNTDRDSLCIDIDLNLLKERMRVLFSGHYDDSFRDKYNVRPSSSYDPESLAMQQSFEEKALQKCIYRPFDIRNIYYKPGFTSRPVYEVQGHMLFPNIGLLFARQSKESFAVLVNRCLSTHKIVTVYDRTSIAPLYLYPIRKKADLFDVDEKGQRDTQRRPNFNLEFVEEISDKVKLKFVSDWCGDLKKTFGPEDVFHYIYAVFHSPEYRRRYAEFLKIDFPRVPMPKSKQLFRKLCNVGEELTKLHLMEAEVLQGADKRVFFGVEGGKVVEKGYPKYVAHADRPQKGKVYINKDQYFEGVTPDVWEFHIGGYRVCEKWLKDRKERTLSYEDISHYQKIVVALGETIRLMNETCLSEMFQKAKSVKP